MAFENNSINYNLADDEELLVCPYDKSHSVLKARFIRHLDLCRKNYRKAVVAKGSTPKLVICPHNFTHQFLEPEMVYHLTVCEEALSNNLAASGVGKATKVPGGLSVSTRTASTSAPPKAKVATAAPGGENWDDEPEVKTYNPLEKLKRESVIYTPQGMTRSEKRNHRERERRRANEGNEEPVTDGKAYIPVGAPGWKR